jgi:hypothetical protein
MGIKNAEFDADFESVEKLKRTHAKKVIIVKITEKFSFVLFLLCANFCL